MHISKAFFTKLQLEWYQKLEQSGFKDIEELRNSEMLLKASALLPLIKTTGHTERSEINFYMESRQDYFSILSERVNDPETIFRSEADKSIMRMRSEGSRIKEICEALAKIGKRRHRGNVRFTIRRYEMRWGVRTYERKELHLKQVDPETLEATKQRRKLRKKVTSAVTKLNKQAQKEVDTKKAHEAAEHEAAMDAVIAKKKNGVS